MLILSRKPGESIVIDGRIVVTVMRLEGEVVKLGIQAPVELPVHRQEVYEEIQRNNREAATTRRSLALKLPPRNLTGQQSPQRKPAVRTWSAPTHNKNTANT
jgi:carbon storage regulator